MTHRQWRLVLGPLFVALIVGILVLDRSQSTPLVSPWIVAALGLAALAEFLGIASGIVWRSGRRATFFVATLLLLGGPLLHLVDEAPAPGILPAGFVFLLAFGVALTWLARRRRQPVEPADLGGWAVGLGAGVAVALPLFCLQECLFRFPEGELFVLTIVLGAKLNDMGGYLVGSAIGRRKLCPGVSPNKTIEGSLAGLVAGIAGTALLGTLFDHGEAPIGAVRGALLGLLLGLTTQASDLFESGVKRAVGVKDSSALVPAFGGTLDMVDSLIFAAPVGYTLGALWLV